MKGDNYDATVKNIIEQIDSFLEQLRGIKENLDSRDKTIQIISDFYPKIVGEEEVDKFELLSKWINTFFKSSKLGEYYGFLFEGLDLSQKNISKQIDSLSNRLKIIKEDILKNGLPKEIINAKKEIIWNLLHDEIVKVSKPSFDAERYGDAVYSAFKQIEIRVKQIYKECTGEELTGKPLMDRAFKIPNNGAPIIDITASENFQFKTSRKNMQSGYHLIFAGAMMALRNPNAHEFVDLEETKAIHYLFLASQLMFLLDNATCSKDTKAIIPEPKSNTSIVKNE